MSAATDSASGGTKSPAETDLEGLLWRLVRGEVELSDLSPALAGWWSVAFAEGQRSRLEPDVERLQFEADYWRFRATNPGVDFNAAMTAALWRDQ